MTRGPSCLTTLHIFCMRRLEIRKKETLYDVLLGGHLIITYLLLLQPSSNSRMDRTRKIQNFTGGTKTDTAPFWAIFYHFETWLYTFLLFHPNYVSKCNERPLIKDVKPKKGLNPSNSNHFCTRLSGLTHFWEMNGQNVHCTAAHIPW